ncbi:MAG: hypothetical protein QOD07_2858 [Frankiaceae bacterium]|nr:hypothetical protein [Frankiaceae bacterium]
MQTTTAAPTMATAATGKTASLLALGLRPVPRTASRGVRRATVAGIVFGAAMVATSAAIHLHLWRIGYRHISEIGPAFLFQWASGFVLAAVLLAWRRLAVVAAGFAFCAGSVVALVLSATVGFLGLHDGLDVPWADWSLASESAGAFVLAVCAGVMLRRR